MTKPTNPPKMKPVKAWAILSRYGKIEEAYDSLAIYRTRDEAIGEMNRCQGERIVRVLITEVPE